MVSASRKKVREVAQRLGKSIRTIRYWIAEGCDIDSEESVEQFVEGKWLRRTNVQKHRERMAALNGATVSDVSGAHGPPRSARPDLDRLLSGELPPPGPKGAGAALQRLEITEERAHAQLLRLIQAGNPLAIREQQECWLKCLETLRRLDLVVEMARRSAEEQIAKHQAEQICLFTAEWLRISFALFLSSEARALMRIKEPGEFMRYAVERFKGILDLTVRSSVQTRSPIPEWAAVKIREAWNNSSPGPNSEIEAGFASIHPSAALQETKK